jgi:hypothetical protein
MLAPDCTMDLRSGAIRTIREFSSCISPNPDGNRIVCDTLLPDIGLCLVNQDGRHHRALPFQATNQNKQWRDRCMTARRRSGWATMTEKVAHERSTNPPMDSPASSFGPDVGGLFTSDHRNAMW